MAPAGRSRARIAQTTGETLPPIVVSARRSRQSQRSCSATSSPAGVRDHAVITFARSLNASERSVAFPMTTRCSRPVRIRAPSLSIGPGGTYHATWLALGNKSKGLATRARSMAAQTRPDCLSATPRTRIHIPTSWPSRMPSPLRYKAFRWRTLTTVEVRRSRAISVSSIARLAIGRRDRRRFGPSSTSSSDGKRVYLSWLTRKEGLSRSASDRSMRRLFSLVALVLARRHAIDPRRQLCDGSAPKAFGQGELAGPDGRARRTEAHRSLLEPCLCSMPDRASRVGEIPCRAPGRASRARSTGRLVLSRRTEFATRSPRPAWPVPSNGRSPTISSKRSASPSIATGWASCRGRN